MRALILFSFLFGAAAAAGGTCGEDIPVAPSESQASLLKVFADIFRVGPGHELTFDTTWGVSSIYTRKQTLAAGVPFSVKQHDYLEAHRDGYGHAQVTLRPLAKGPMDLTFIMGVKDFATNRLSPERKLEIRKQMSEGNVRALGDDPHVDVQFGYSGEAAPEVRAWLKEGTGRGIRLARASEAVLLEDMGVFEAVARMRRAFGSEFLLRPVMVLLTTYENETRLSGTLRVLGSTIRHPLVESLGLYLNIYRTLAEGRPGLLGLLPSGSVSEIPPGVAEIRQAYEKSASAEARSPALRTFRVRTPAGELTIEGYENKWLQLARTVAPAKAEPGGATPPTPAAAPAVEPPVVEQKAESARPLPPTVEQEPSPEPVVSAAAMEAIAGPPPVLKSEAAGVFALPAAQPSAPVVKLEPIVASTPPAAPSSAPPAAKPAPAPLKQKLESSVAPTPPEPAAAPPAVVKGKRTRGSSAKASPSKRPSRKGTRGRRAPATEPSVDAKPPQE